MSASKRKNPPTTATSPKTKKSKSVEANYHLAPQLQGEDGEVIWPAPKKQMEAARQFIVECAYAKKRTLIVPDKDADGLSSGAILYRTLSALGLPSTLITMHHLQKGTSVHDASERDLMASSDPSYIFVLDQGSRPGPPLIPTPHKALIIDHHHSSGPADFPEGAQYVTASGCPPVSTTSLLTYMLCAELHPPITDPSNAWLCALGTHGDLGQTFRWELPFPSMDTTFSSPDISKSAINTAVSLINAPRRSAAFSPTTSWAALLTANSPSSILKNEALQAARAEVAQETERWAHTAPMFSADAACAVLRIRSAAQVHPVIATRWAGHLKSPRLKVVMCANEGYVEGRVHFSCRIAKCARGRGEEVNLIETLRGWGREAGLLKSGDNGEDEEKGENEEDDEAKILTVGESFARGHPEASGGVVPTAVFERLIEHMGVGRRPNNGIKRAQDQKVDNKAQKNTLNNYFKTGVKNPVAAVEKA